MKTEYLKSFSAVVESKSFSAAAKRLFLSQPAISTHIKQLEEELCVQLLTRSTKDVQLTEAGLLFYPYAQRLLETEKEALFALHGKETVLKGTVQIAASTVPANYILSEFIPYMGRKYPDILYSVSGGDSSEVLQKVLHFDTEIGICGFQARNQKCIYDELFEDDIVLITPNEPCYAAYGGKITPEQLTELRFVVREKGSGTGMAAHNLEQSLGLTESSMHIVAQFESTELIKRAVAGGSGSAFIAKIAAMDYVKEGRVLMFEFPKLDSKRSFYMVHHRDRILSQPAAVTMKELSAFCRRGDFSKDLRAGEKSGKIPQGSADSRCRVQDAGEESPGFTGQDA